MFVAYGLWAGFLGSLLLALTLVLFVSALISLRRQTLARRAARRHTPLGAYAGVFVTAPWLIFVATRTIQYPERLLEFGLFAYFGLPQLALFLLSAYILSRHCSTTSTRRLEPKKSP
jgi:hypothetical protein